MTQEHKHHHHDHEDQGHSHAGHAHSHAPKNFTRAFAIGITLNAAFIAVETIYGLAANSTALLSDAGHNLSDVLGLLAAWMAATLVKRAPSSRFTYGLRGSSILAALFNAIFLLVAIGGLSWEAILRFSNPQPVSSGTVMVVAAIGILINGITAWMFASGSKSDINIRGAYLHMAADAALSAGVVVIGFLIFLTGLLWLDPLASLSINAVIVFGTWSLLRDSVAMSMAAVPANINPEKVRNFLGTQTGVSNLHDLHIWPLSTTETALTCHLVMPGGHPGDAYLHHLCEELNHHFHIAHSTIQVETDPNLHCPLEPADKV
jgi:cobalt-zinc-cadmium efflux system protein